MNKERTAKKAGWLAAAILGTNLAGISAWADEARTIAKELSKGARKAGVERIAVLPLIPAAGVGSEASRDLSERITTEIVRYGRLQLVERALLGRIMEEHALARTGIVDQTSLRRLGKVLSVEAVLTGTFVTRGGRTLVNARIIHVETGAVLSAAQAGLSGRSAAAEPIITAALVDSEPYQGEPLAEMFSLESDEKSGLRDSFGDLACAGAADKVDAYEKLVLELKARHWALQLRQGVSLSKLQSTGMIITDETLRSGFYALVAEHARSESARELSAPEMRHLAFVDEKAFRLHRDCSL